MKKYHPSRVLTLVYQPFAIGTLIVLAYYESKINTRLRNLAGFTLFFVATFLVLIVSKSFSNFIILFAAACSN
jgi:equilibrative nucleoside transporter 1/2/3